MRLNQYLARAGFGSRRACEELIREGAVTINGHRLRELATRVEADDNVLVNGKPVKMPLPIVAILHKPPGFLCTSTESTKERTIYDLLPTGWPRVVYVGRLDKDSEGLLVVTNDGNLAQRLTHPSTKIPKTYIVTLDREFDFALAPKLKKGVVIEEGFARMDEIFRVGPRGLKVVLTQGLKRQIREMFYKFGYEVKRLVRVQIGGLPLGDLAQGQHRVLTQEEVKRYFPAKPPPGAKPAGQRVKTPGERPASSRRDKRAVAGGRASPRATPPEQQHEATSILKETSAKVNFGATPAGVAVALRATVESKRPFSSLRRTECDGYPTGLLLRSLKGCQELHDPFRVGKPIESQPVGSARGGPQPPATAPASLRLAEASPLAQRLPKSGNNPKGAMHG